jgi:hypothetical protein
MALFDVDSLEDITDRHSVIAAYQWSPTLYSSELREMAGRIDDFFRRSGMDIAQYPDTNSEQAAHRILNSTPATLPDIKDYIVPEDLSSIHRTYNAAQQRIQFPETDGLGPDLSGMGMGVDGFSEMTGAGCLAMMAMTESDVRTLEGLPEQQAVTERGAEYYLLHRYGYPPASLWLAKFLNPANFCYCQNKDCKGRHFGFTDIHASYELVLQNQDFIRAVFSEEMRNVSNDPKASEHQQSDYAELIVDAIESLLIVDQRREEEGALLQLIRLAVEGTDHLTDDGFLRLSMLALVVSTIYDGKDLFERMGFTGFESPGALLDSTLEGINAVAQNRKEKPANKEMFVYDAMNFFVAGCRLNEPQFGKELMIAFYASIFSADHFEYFVFQLRMIQELLEEENLPENEETFIANLMGGYKRNVVYVLSKRSESHQSHVDALMGSEISGDSIKLLSELGFPDAVKRRVGMAQNEHERNHFKRVLQAQFIARNTLDKSLS